MGVNEASFCSPPVKFTHAIVEPSLLRLPLGLLLGIAARDLLFQPHCFITAHRPGLEGVQTAQIAIVQVVHQYENNVVLLAGPAFVSSAATTIVIDRHTQQRLRRLTAWLFYGRLHVGIFVILRDLPSVS